MPVPTGGRQFIFLSCFPIPFLSSSICFLYWGGAMYRVEGDFMLVHQSPAILNIYDIINICLCIYFLQIYKCSVSVQGSDTSLDDLL